MICQFCYDEAECVDAENKIYHCLSCLRYFVDET